MKRAPRSLQHHVLYRKYNGQDSEISALLGKCGINVLRGAPNGIFLAYYLNNAKRKEIAGFAQGNSVVHLYGSQLSQLSVAQPHPNEQRKIANFLSAIDIKLEQFSKELIHARMFKQGLLQQLFV
jgi:type I restriction enzyme S subunit